MPPPVRGAPPPSARHRPARDAHPGACRNQQRHRRDQIVQPLIIVEAADEADHVGLPVSPSDSASGASYRHSGNGSPNISTDRRRSAKPEFSPPDRRRVRARSRRSPSQITATAVRTCFTAQVSSARIALYFSDPFRARPVADRRILPEGADLVEQRQACVFFATLQARRAHPAPANARAGYRAGRCSIA